MIVFKTIFIAIAGGYIFSLFKIPLAWMLGSMTALLLWTQAYNKEAFFPSWLRNGSLIVLGYVLGRPFTMQTALEILNQLPVMLIINVAMLLFCFALGYMIARRTGVSVTSGLLGSVPGGLSQMVLLCEEIAGADLAIVSFMQTIRLLTVVFVVPFIAMHSLGDAVPVQSGGQVVVYAGDDIGRLLLYVPAAVLGAVVARRISAPMPYMLGPMLATPLVTLVGGVDAPALPSQVTIAAQLCFGAYLGTNTRVDSLANWRSLLPATLLSSLAIVAFSLIAGRIMAQFHSCTLTTGFLGTAPGGMTEIGIAALTMGADLSVVMAFQLFRLLFIVLVIPPVFRKFFNSSENNNLCKYDV